MLGIKDNPNRAQLFFRTVLGIVVATMLLGILPAGCKRVAKENNPLAKERTVLPDVSPISGTKPFLDLADDEAVEYLGHHDNEVRLQTSDEFVAMKEPPVDELLKGLNHENYHVRAGAAFTLGRIAPNDQAIIDTLRKISESDEREAVRDAATFAIESIQSAN